MTYDPRKMVEEAFTKVGFENVRVDKIIDVVTINAAHKGKEIQIKLTEKDLKKETKNVRRIFRRILET